MDDFKNNLANLIKVKTIITLAVVGALVYGFIVSKVDTDNFMLVAIMVVTYYFNKKDTLAPNTSTTETTATPGEDEDIAS